MALRQIISYSCRVKIIHLLKVVLSQNLLGLVELQIWPPENKKRSKNKKNLKNAFLIQNKNANNVFYIYGYYRDFLNGIDNLHETMRFSYPRMSSPSFYVSAEDQHGCLLHYKSRRTGFTQYVVGQLIQCATTFYGVDLEVKVVEERAGDEGCHVVFRLDFDNSAFILLERSRHKSGLVGTYGHISAKTFFKVNIA